MVDQDLVWVFSGTQGETEDVRLNSVTTEKVRPEGRRGRRGSYVT